MGAKLRLAGLASVVVTAGLVFIPPTLTDDVSKETGPSTPSASSTPAEPTPAPTTPAPTVAPERKPALKPEPKPKPKPKPVRLTGVKTIARSDSGEIRTVAVPAENIRFIASNIKFARVNPSFEADYSRILRAQPDFVVLGEEAARPDEALARDNYSVYRSNESVATKSTPVVWDSARWEPVSKGSRTLVNLSTKWGESAVNWVTLRSRTTGRVVSVVSAHAPPTIPSNASALPIYMNNLYSLVDELKPLGDVMVGGDFNVHYRGARWVTSGLNRGLLVATFDKFGAFPTHDGGGIIDFMLTPPDTFLTATAQGWWEQASDHDAIWSDWTLASPRTVVPGAAFDLGTGYPPL